MVAWLGPAIGAAGSLLGGLLGQSSASRSRDEANQLAREQMQMQYEFAQNGLRWKVEDAKRAGIHPLYAVGAPATSYAPVSVGGRADMSMANAVSDMGQNIGRAVNATKTQDERTAAFVAQQQGYQLENARLQNEFLRTQIESSRMRMMNQAGVPPAFPGATNTSGQGALPDALSVIAGSYTDPAPPVDPNRFSDVSHGTSRTGFPVVPGKEMKERMEDSLLLEIPWFIRNLLLPTLGMNWNPPTREKLGKDERWIFNPTKMEYQKMPNWGIDDPVGYGRKFYDRKFPRR